MHGSLAPLSRNVGKIHNQTLLLVRIGWQYRISPFSPLSKQHFASSSSSERSNDSSNDDILSSSSSRNGSSGSSRGSKGSTVPSQKPAKQPGTLPPDWDENPDLNISAFSELPSSNFGVNQHMLINDEFKEALRQILWQFRAPIRYAFAYGSGVFPQSGSSSIGPSKLHPHPSPAISTVQKGEGKMIDFIFGVSYTQHWHSLNLQQHRDHYSAAGYLRSYLVSRIQDNWGAGVYFNPFVTVNGTLIKYGVVNLDTLCRDLSEWDTMYLAGRLQKPVKILRDDPRVRLANQINLLSAVRTALLLLPPNFSERELYSSIAGLSYMGDPRMSFGAENQDKVANIVRHQLPNFRRLYAPLIENLPNVSFTDAKCASPDWIDDPEANVKLAQDMDPKKRGNMVRRLPKSFRSKLYFQYQSKFQIPQMEFNKMLEETSDADPTRVRKQQGGAFEQRIAGDEQQSLTKEVGASLQRTIKWPSYSQSLKGPVTAGVAKSWRYLKEKSQKNREGKVRAKDSTKIRHEKETEKSK